MISHLYQQQCSHLWVCDGSGECEGVLLRKTRGNYLAYPRALLDSQLAQACENLNLQVRILTLLSDQKLISQVAMTVNSRVIKTFLAWAPEAIDVPLMNGLRVQVLPTISDLHRARKYQFAAFIASDSLLVVWDDNPSNVVKRAATIENELMQLVWRTGEAGEEDETINEKDKSIAIDLELGELFPEIRPTNFLNTILVAFTLIIVVTLLGLACRSLATEIAIDGSYLRLAFLLLVPVQIFFTLVSRVRSVRYPV